MSNAVDNRVVTFSGATTLNGESNLTFDGNKININSGVVHKRTAVTSTMTASAANYILGVSASSNIIIQLPNASTLSNGQVFVIKDEAGNAGNYPIVVKAHSSQTIDGSDSVTLESPHAAVNVYTNGTDKFFIY